ncbi:MAG TPA: (2Fe-2S)-binding protein [Chloroflexi bacterium]|jgi:cytochrome b6-f complex iron-sulfur subunit|nr:(2Fe-2S)-binding protein [Chloroflexota bacterium]
MKHHQKKRPPTAKNDDRSQLSRRNFLRMGIGALSALALLEVGGASLLFMKPRSLEGEFGGLVKAGPVDSFPSGSVVEFPDGRFFLVRSLEGGFLAVYRRCTHLGCSVNWEPDQNRFFCPCHASSFDLHGDVENPPAPRALDTFPVQITDGQVIVDTGRAQSRDTFTQEQLVYA